MMSSSSTSNENLNTIFIHIVIILALILINAFFAMAEIAVISLNDNKIKKMADAGHKKANRILDLTKNSSSFLATIQVGVTVSGFLTSASASNLFSERLSDLISFLPLSKNVLEAISTISVTLILSYFSLVLGELVPKKIAMQNPEKISFKIVNILMGIKFLFSPFIKFLSISTNLVLKIIGIDPKKDENIITEEEILMLVDIGEEKGIIKESAKNMIRNIFDFDDKNVDEIMTHRTNILAVKDTESINIVIKIMKEYGYSRIPVFHENLDNIIGIVYIKDLLKNISNNKFEKQKITDIMRTPFYVPGNKKCSELFNEMASNKIQIAIIVDEYGGTDGLITMENLLESIVGNIQDEYDNEAINIQKIDDNTLLIEGNTSIYEVSKVLNIEFPNGDYDTLAGMIVEYLGKIPKENEHPSINIKNFTFKVESTKNRRISKVSVKIN